MINVCNRIKICPDLHKLQLWFSRLRQCLFLKLLRQWTHKMGRFLSTLKHSHPIFIWYTNSRRAFGWSLYIRQRSDANVLNSAYKYNADTMHAVAKLKLDCTYNGAIVCLWTIIIFRARNDILFEFSTLFTRSQGLTAEQESDVI